MKISNVALAFLDGLSPLDALVERPKRPGSDESLIKQNSPKMLDMLAGLKRKKTVVHEGNVIPEARPVRR